MELNKTKTEIFKWKFPLGFNIPQPKRHWWYELTYPKGSRCPYCNARLHNELLKESRDGSNDGWGKHYRLFEFRCLKDNYIYQEWM